MAGDIVRNPTIFRDPTQPTIPTGTGLILRPWEPADAPILFEAYTDPAIQRWNLRSVPTVDAAGELIRRWRATWADGSEAHWAVIEAAVVGRVALVRMDLPRGQAEVGYWTMPRARGRAIASRAVAALADWSFAAGVHRLELTHSTRNPASCHTAERTGFALEGTKRSAGHHADGWHDMHLHARINPHAP